jgi:transcriptional regulator with XRE-family HTH domain
MKPGTSKPSPFRDIGERVRVARGSRTRKEFASILGVTVQALSLIELGQRKPSHEMLRKLRDGIGVSPDTIMFGPPTDAEAIRELMNSTMLHKLSSEDRELFRRLLWAFAGHPDVAKHVRVELGRVLREATAAAADPSKKSSKK